MITEQESRDSKLFLVFYETTRRLPQEVIEWSQSPEGKTALEDWDADYRAAIARWGEEDAEAQLLEDDPDAGKFFDSQGKEIRQLGSETSDAGV
jgi:hypothetical protein